jgi:type IV pilus assembly protein PilV
VLIALDNFFDEELSVKSENFQRGVGLIEVLVTVLLLGSGLLAIASMQVRSLQQNTESMIRTEANIIAYDIFERIRMASQVAPAALDEPTTAELDDLAAELPDGDIELDCDADRLCTVTITWGETARSNDAADQQEATFSYSATL